MWQTYLMAIIHPPIIIIIIIITLDALILDNHTSNVLDNMAIWSIVTGLSPMLNPVERCNLWYIAIHHFTEATSIWVGKVSFGGLQLCNSSMFMELVYHHNLKN